MIIYGTDPVHGFVASPAPAQHRALLSVQLGCSKPVIGWYWVSIGPVLHASIGPGFSRCADVY